MGDGSCSSTCSLRPFWCSIWASRPCWRGTGRHTLPRFDPRCGGCGAFRPQSPSPWRSIVGTAVLQRHPDVPVLVFIAALVSLLHLATYAPRAALRAAGEARLEAWSKVVERSVMTGGYALFMVQGESEVLPYALVLAAGAAAGWLCSAGLLHRTLGPNEVEPSRLGAAWGASWRSLLVAGAPFALTAAVLPYVSRIEKFLLAEVHGYDAVAVFHVAQMAWVAGLVVPAAIRAALIPAFGAVRHSSEGHGGRHARRGSMDCSACAAWLARRGMDGAHLCWTASFPPPTPAACSAPMRATSSSSCCRGGGWR